MLLRCQEKLMDGIAKVAFLFIFWRERICMIHICRASAIKTCRSHDLVSSVLFCSALPLFHSLSVHISPYDDNFTIVNEWDSLCQYSIVCVTHHALVTVWFEWINIGIFFVYSKSDIKLSFCFFFFFTIFLHKKWRKRKKERKLSEWSLHLTAQRRTTFVAVPFCLMIKELFTLYFFWISSQFIFEELIKKILFESLNSYQRKSKKNIRLVK